MSVLTIINAPKTNLYNEIDRLENVDNCSNSNLVFTLSGVGVFPISMLSNIEPGGGYVKINTTNNIIQHNGSYVNVVEFNTGWTDPQGGSHFQEDQMTITLNGTETFGLEVKASEVCRDSTTQNMILLTCWEGQQGGSYPSANVSLTHNGQLLTSLSNIKHMSPCDSISAE